MNSLGAKLKENENLPDALARELSEELGLDANVDEHITAVVHTYPKLLNKNAVVTSSRLETFSGELSRACKFCTCFSYGSRKFRLDRS
jgi:8-oxo-dGTP pyrophosphatase MutT (NUDIX family)